MTETTTKQPPVDFRTEPARYKHWKLTFDGPVATLTMDVQEEGGLRPGYELKLNSYDLGVDIELYDALQRLRFEHPEVGAVILTSGKDRVFCAGANIRMLGQSSHGWKVNFCKFTNETRNAIEDAGAHSGQTYLAMVNGPCAGGGYELALDDLILHLRTNEETIGLWVFKTAGDADLVEAYDRLLAEHAAHWLVREVRLYLKRVFKRLDVSSR